MTIEFAVFVTMAESLLEMNPRQGSFCMFEEKGILIVQASGDERMGRQRRFPSDSLKYLQRRLMGCTKEDIPRMLLNTKTDTHWAFKRPLELLLSYSDWEPTEFELHAVNGKLVLGGEG
jgi:hypothetical protein